MCEGDIVVSGWGDSVESASMSRPHLMLRSAIDSLNGAMVGYVMSSEEVDRVLSDLAYAVTQPTLPVYEIEEQLSVLSGRIPPQLFDSIASTLADFKKVCEEQVGSEVQPLILHLLGLMAVATDSPGNDILTDRS